MNTSEISTPYAADAEKSLLSMAMLEPDEIMPAAIADGVDASWFYIPAHRIIWNALESRFRDKKSLDITSLMQHLNEQNQYEAVGGNVGFCAVKSFETCTRLYSAHLEILKEQYERRKILELARLATVKDNKLYREACRELAASFTDEADSHRPTFAEMVRKAMESMQEMINKGTHISGLRTGFPELDFMQGGLRPGELIIAGARPGMGKSIFGMNIALTAARQCCKQNSGRVVFLSLEMSSEELITRLVQSMAEVNLFGLAASKDNALKVAKNPDLMRAQEELNTLPMDIIEAHGMDIARITLQLEAEHRKNPLALVVVDYVQCIQGASKMAKESTIESVSDASRGLKNAARRLNIPVLALAQVNRDAANSGAAGKRPTLAQLKGSGSLEQDADSVILLHREEYYDKAKENQENTENESIMEIILAKNRHGITGTEHARFIGKHFLIKPQNSDT